MMRQLGSCMIGVFSVLAGGCAASEDVGGATSQIAVRGIDDGRVVVAVDDPDEGAGDTDRLYVLTPWTAGGRLADLTFDGFADFDGTSLVLSDATGAIVAELTAEPASIQRDDAAKVFAGASLVEQIGTLPEIDEQPPIDMIYELDPDEDCESGGVGSSSCSVDGCSVTCAAGYYACCDTDWINECGCRKNPPTIHDHTPLPGPTPTAPVIR